MLWFLRLSLHFHQRCLDCSVQLWIISILFRDLLVGAVILVVAGCSVTRLIVVVIVLRHVDVETHSYVAFLHWLVTSGSTDPNVMVRF